MVITFFLAYQAKLCCFDVPVNMCIKQEWQWEVLDSNYLQSHHPSRHRHHNHNSLYD